jgi:AcrR family transcriptional regulator
MELKDRIIQEAASLFFRNGVKSMTMSDIANQMGISKRTLYEVFQDKEELLEECINVHIKKIDREMENLTNNAEDVIDALMRMYAKQLSNAQGINKSVLHDLKKYYLPIYKRIESQQQNGYYIFVPLLEKGIQQGLIRKDINFEVVMWLVRAQFKALIDDDYIPTDKYSVNEFIGAIILNVIRGIATMDGMIEIDRRIEKMKEERKETTL